MSEAIKKIGQQIGQARNAVAQGNAAAARSAAQTALDEIQKIELSYENLDWRQLAEGDAQHLLGNIPAAEKAYRQAMIAAPNQPGGYQRLAELLQTQQRDDDFTKHMDVSLRKFPDHPTFLKMQAVRAAANNNYDDAIPALAKAYQADNDDHAVCDTLGICLQNINHFDEAVIYHARAFELQPTNALYALRFGMAMAGAGANESAIELYKIALSLDPNLADAYSQLGHEYQKTDQNDEAVKTYQDGLTKQPNHGALNFNYGRFLQDQGDTANALTHFQKAMVAGGPQADTAHFFIASLTDGEKTPNSPPPEFVRSLFDFYAKDFENSLINNLQYRAPGELKKLLTSDAAKTVLDITKSPATIVDLGCGTGLCGVLLKEYAASMTGVDMSPNMIRRAQEKQIYTEFKHQNVVTFLQTAPAQHYSVAVAGDLLIYVGDAAEFFTGLNRAITAPGLAVLTAEALPENDMAAGFKLLPTARYAHKESYLRQLAEHSGFKVITVEHGPLRQHQGQDIAGIYMLLGK